MKHYWLIHSLTFASLVLFIVPIKYIKKLFLYALIGGIIYTWGIHLLSIHIFSFWKFNSGIFILHEVPVFFSICWFFVTLLYGYLLLIYTDYQFYLLIFFALWSALMNYFAEASRMLLLIDWDLFLTFQFALFSHVLLLYILKWMFKVKELGSSHENILLFKRKKN